MNIKEILNQPEGRRLEFKAELPEHSDLAKTVVAFANDAGGDLYIGVADDPREVVGLDEDKLVAIEEKVSNIIFDRCYPAILPEIKFISEENKHLIQVTVFRGSTPPYYLKEKGKLQGTFIRVGSTNRLADEAIISELERRRRNISFDSEVIPDKPVNDLSIDGFKAIFKEKTGEELSDQALRKLDLVKDMQGVKYPTNALILFSDDPLRNSLFHYAKVECARFKGVSIDDFIDQKVLRPILPHKQRKRTTLCYVISIKERPLRECTLSLAGSTLLRQYVRRFVRRWFIGIILSQERTLRLQSMMIW